MPSQTHHTISSYRRNHKMATTSVDDSNSDNMPVRKIDLSDTTRYHSDGVPRFRHMTREDNGMFLKNLTEAFNNNSRFVTELGKCPQSCLSSTLSCCW